MTHKLNDAFTKSFRKKQYFLVLLRCMFFSSLLVLFWIFMGTLLTCISDKVLIMPGLNKIFNAMYAEYIKVFIIVTFILFVTNRNRRDISGLNDKKEYNTFKKVNEPIFKQRERQEKINEILNNG